MPNEQTEEIKLDPITPEKRELLLKYFSSRSPEKQMNEQEIKSIKDYVDRNRGGLKREAYALIKDDKELVKAASIQQAQRDQRVMNKRAPEVREVLLKLLRSNPGEKNLSLPEFKQVAVFLDPKHGGIRRHAYQIFKEDKEVIEAAEKHRNLRKEMDRSKEGSKAASLDQTKQETEKALKSVMARKGRSVSADKSMEIGE